MSCILPPEILDLVIDHLHDERAALKTCCVVSKSWAPRTRSHLFARVELNASRFHMDMWKRAFPDPSNSPAHYTSTLCVSNLQTLTITNRHVGSWIRTFRNVAHLEFLYVGPAALIPFYGLSPTVRSLRVAHSTAEVFDLICSFPLLEDLALVALSFKRRVDPWNPPPTSPKLTGSLNLRALGTVPPVARRLLDIPGGLRFSNIKVVFSDNEAQSVRDLVLTCSDTLESLTTRYFPSGAFFQPPWLTSTSSLFAEAGIPGMVPHDLSKAMKLKRITFLQTTMGSTVQWITMALQTVVSKNLRSITICVDRFVLVTVGEAAHQEWNDLDRLLVQFWNTHSIRPRVTRLVGKDMRDFAQSLLPELTRRELVDLVGI